MFTYPATVVFGIVFVIFTLILLQRTSRYPLPPGPTGYPLIGNILDSANVSDWKLFPGFRERWGDITSVTTFGSTIVTVHTYEQAVQLLNKKSGIYSCRSKIEMLHLGGLEHHVALLPYGPQLKECRRMLRADINQGSIQQYYPLQEATTLRFLRSLAKSPTKFYELIEWYTGSIILKTVYGYETLDSDDPMIAIANPVLSKIGEVTEPGYLVELLPWLRHAPSWLPYSGFKQKTMVMKQEYEKMLQIPFDYAMKHKDQAGVESNFVTRWLKKIDPESEDQMLCLKESALIFFSGGVETTSSALSCFFFKMQEYPTIQKRAQAEIDAVVGTERLPSFHDRADLPFINALCKEILRYNPPVPAGVPHKSLTDDLHDGYYIPKGTVVIASIAEMARDPSVYADPDAFNPSRFLGLQPERDPTLYVFGFGRRKCSGLPLAQNTLFLAVSTILASFDISPAIPASKSEVPSGMLSHLPPFKCSITPRPSAIQNWLGKVE